ncbi:MAG: hypothetical protein ACYTGS_18465 [Planctomycetota bacterium]|jgi:hypothetical protein
MDALFTDDELLETTQPWDTAPEHTDNLIPIQWNSFGPVEKFVRADTLTHTNTLYL